MKTTFSIDQIPSLVTSHLVPLLKTHTIFSFVGPLGAGKTTMIKEFLKQRGVTSVITSPTFGYVNTYQGSENHIYHHFDLYRITSVEEFMHAGFAEYFHQPNTYAIIEWPEVIQQFLNSPDLRHKVCSISLSYCPETIDKRTIAIVF